MLDESLQEKQMQGAKTYTKTSHKATKHLQLGVDVWRYANGSANAAQQGNRANDGYTVSRQKPDSLIGPQVNNAAKPTAHGCCVDADFRPEIDDGANENTGRTRIDSGENERTGSDSGKQNRANQKACATNEIGHRAVFLRW